MAWTKVQICNMALYHLGISKTISALTDQTQQAIVLSLIYDTALDMALSDADWRFASKRATLTAATSDPYSEWGYAYLEPADMVIAREIVDSLQQRQHDASIGFEIEWHAAEGKKVIFTDQVEAELRYTFRQTDDQQYSPAFGMYLSWVLAREAALALTNSRTKLGDCDQGAQRALDRAIAWNWNSRKGPRPEQASPSEQARL